jgi:hypothetical protein
LKIANDDLIFYHELLLRVAGQAVPCSTKQGTYNIKSVHRTPPKNPADMNPLSMVRGKKEGEKRKDELF